MYCLSCATFHFDFIYEYASPALKVELRKLSQDDMSETDKLKQIVRMHARFPRLLFHPFQAVAETVRSARSLLQNERLLMLSRQ
jgi:hypothetical protein